MNYFQFKSYFNPFVHNDEKWPNKLTLKIFIMHGRVKWSEKSTLHLTCYFWILPNFQFYNEAYQWIFYKKGYCEKFSMILENTCNGVFLGWKWQQLKLVTYFKKWFHLNCLVLNIEKVLQASICWSFFEPYFSRKSMFHESY